MQRDAGVRADRSAHSFLDIDRGQLTANITPTVALAASSLQFPTAIFSILDDTTQYFLVSIGSAADLPASAPRADLPCDAVVAHEEPVVLNATELARWHVPGRCYVGAPVLSADGIVVGSLCIIDVADRSVTSAMLGQLQTLAGILGDQLELLRTRRETRDTDIYPPTESSATADVEVTDTTEPTAREIAQALAAGEIVPWYQPIVALDTGRRVAVEALARWLSPERGLVAPAVFIPIAERGDLVVDVDLEIWARALADLAQSQRREPELRLSINMAARHTQHEHCAERLAALADTAGVATSSIDLELTESSRLALSVGGHESLTKLREAGFAVLLDDFGTGWSSISAFLQLPCDGFKIDRSITARLVTPAGTSLLRAISASAFELGLRTTIEGVETPEIAALAHQLGFTHGQGYHWGRPAPAIA